MTKILVIEDEQSARENILELLEAQGFETLGAHNGRVGVTWAWEHKPDLIVCDVMMPEVDGYEVLKLLREDPITATTPFIFLSAKANKADLRQGMELGADDYLTKPFTKKELFAAIAVRLKKQAAIAQQTGKLLVNRLQSNNDQNKSKNTNTFTSDLIALNSAKFSGRLLVKSSQGIEWTFYLDEGQILYTSGGIHPIRRWQRYLATYCPQILINQLNLPSELAGSAWEYQLLGLWLKQQQITPEQVTQIIREIVNEVLFDILLAEEVMYQTQPDDSLSWQPLSLIDVQQVLTTAQLHKQSWQTAKLTKICPNKALYIKRPDLLAQQTSTSTYRQLCALLNGQRSIRDIAFQTKRQIWEIPSSLLPYIQTGTIELIDIPDLPLSFSTAPEKISCAAPLKKPMIACIDDSPLVCQMMEHIVTEAGYQFVGVQDPLRAIAILLNSKPDLIFLDLVMPNLNGYEICTRLRKISAFCDIPIVIFSGNIIDRVRAKLVGASDYLNKPVKSESVLKLVSDYLGEK